MKTSSLTCFAFILIAIRCTIGTIVETSNGKLLGSYNGVYYSYLNVPYAESPTGSNRFEPPQPLTRRWTGIRNATLPFVACVKFSKLEEQTNGVEDCLILNIFTPAISCGRLYPVHVHLHGGAFMVGAPGDLLESYSASKEMVLVIPAYRVGPFGFLSSGSDLISGNFGLKDQQMALQWVKKNIHTFCGDTSQILFSGSSAGGASVHLHLLNPNSCQYFNAAMSKSGVAVNPWAIQPNAKEQFAKIVNYLGCQAANEANVKLCLQSRTKEEIFEATNTLKVFNNNPVNVFGVVVEPKTVRGAFLTEHPRILIQRGQICETPWVVSHTSREGSFTAAEFLRMSNGVELIEVLNRRWHEIAPLVLCYNNTCVGCSEEKASKFRDDYSDYLRYTYMQGREFSAGTYLLLEKMFTDIMFVNGVEEMVYLHRLYGKAPVYMYDYRNPQYYSIGNVLANRTDWRFGPAHGADGQFVTPLKFLLIFNPTYTVNDQFIAENLIEMGRELSISGIAKFNGKRLPINNATHTGKLIIYESSYEIESYSREEGYTKTTYSKLLS